MTLALLIGLVSPARAEGSSPDSDLAPDAGFASRAADAGSDLDGDEAAAPMLEATVSGRTAAREVVESAAPVTVVETQVAQQQSADLGEVLARVQGVSVQRAGGLGSQLRFSMNGLTDQDIRFFLDGLPLELTGYPFGLADVPVNLVDRVDVYRGVVPIRLATDALGGAVELISAPIVPGLHAALSAEGGSFGTVRFTASAQEVTQSGFLIRASGFFDATRNDYPVDVQVPAANGMLVPTTVDFPNESYRAGGGSLELGLVDRPWAKQLSLRLFTTGDAHGVGTNIVMTTPYGAVTSSELQAGGIVNYLINITNDLSLEARGGYSRDQTRFLDLSHCIYDWYGDCQGMSLQGGEVERSPHDQRQRESATFARVHLGWTLPGAQSLHLTLGPTFTTAKGEDAAHAGAQDVDPLRARKNLFTLVGGLEEVGQFFDGALENQLFVKGYFEQATATIPVFYSNSLGAVVSVNHDHLAARSGAGDAARLFLRKWLWLKASYEYATRLPGPDELFGDGALTLANPDLQPEQSHNANLSVTVDARRTPSGAWRADVNGFLREASHLLDQLCNDTFCEWQNIYSARSAGAEGALGWTSPGDHLALDANGTWQSFRNTSTGGEYRFYQGDRIPDRPWLFANASARFQLRSLLRHDDEAALQLNLRYVHGFYVTWESAGVLAEKRYVPDQTLLSAALSWRAPLETKLLGPVRLSASVEAQNILNEKAYDFFGVQKPGRAFYAKLTLEK